MGAAAVIKYSDRNKYWYCDSAEKSTNPVKGEERRKCTLEELSTNPKSNRRCGQVDKGEKPRQRELKPLTFPSSDNEHAAAFLDADANRKSTWNLKVQVQREASRLRLPQRLQQATPPISASEALIHKM